MRRARQLGCAMAIVLVLSSCATPSIEEMGRGAIKEQAAEGMEWFRQFTAEVDTSDRDRVRSRFQGADVPHSFGWDPDGVFYADRYFRDHLTTSGGWWGEQRTVSACVRYMAKPGGAAMASVPCPDKPPFNERVDESVSVP